MKDSDIKVDTMASVPVSILCRGLHCRHRLRSRDLGLEKTVQVLPKPTQDWYFVTHRHA